MEKYKWFIWDFSQDKDLICVWKIVKNIQIVLGQPIMKGSNWLYSTWKLYLNTKRYKPETIRQQAMSSAFWQIVAILCWPKVKVGRSEKVEIVQKKVISVKCGLSRPYRIGRKIQNCTTDFRTTAEPSNFGPKFQVRNYRRQNGPRTRPVYRKPDQTK